MTSSGAMTSAGATTTAGAAAPTGAAPATTPAPTARERAVRAQLVLAAGLLEIALRRRQVPQLAAAAGRAAGSAAARRYPVGRRTLTPARLDELAADAGAYWRGESACLSRSLLRGWLAATAGHGAAVVVGVRRQPGTPFAAHAWLEVDGTVHAEEPDPTVAYQPIARYPVADQRRPSA